MAGSVEAPHELEWSLVLATTNQAKTRLRGIEDALADPERVVVPDPVTAATVAVESPRPLRRAGPTPSDPRD